MNKQKNKFLKMFSDYTRVLMRLKYVVTIFIALMMEAVHTSETSVYLSETTWRYIPEDCHLHYCKVVP
jgi:hypothetical protein